MDKRKKTIMSWLEGLADDDWQYHSDSEVQEIARSALALLEEQEKATDIVRCKDCIHCGHADPSRLLWGEEPMPVFPDDKCPCQCDDYYYSWLPDPDWFCANGERRASGND